MAYQRFFDEEMTRAGDLACINDVIGQLQSYALDLSTTTASIEDVPPGIYRAFLAGMDPSLVVAVVVASSTRTVDLPTSGSTPTFEDPPCLFPGNAVERLRVIGGVQTVNARLVSGSATMYLVPVVVG